MTCVLNAYNIIQMIPKRDIQIFRDIYYAKYFSGVGEENYRMGKKFKIKGKIKNGQRKTEENYIKNGEKP